MAAQSLAMGGSVCIKKSFGNVRLQPGQKLVSVSLNPLTVDVPNARLAKEAILSESRNPSEKLVNVSLIPLKNNLEKARLVTEVMSSESQKLLQGDTILSFTSIFKDSLDTDEDTAAVVTADILHQWMTESVMEIVRHIREAPFLYYIFERNVSSETPRRHKLPQDSLEGADGWPVLRDLLRNVLPDGVVLVKKLDDNSVTQSSSTSESGMSNEMKGFDKVGSTNVWGLLIQGRGAGVNACYILKTTEIISAHGCCTQFCLTKAKCFGQSPYNQFIQSWLL